MDRPWTYLAGDSMILAIQIRIHMDLLYIVSPPYKGIIEI